METQHHTTRQNLAWNLKHKFKKLECQHGTIKQFKHNNARKKSLKKITQ
jgi:hypothetical protein